MGILVKMVFRYVIMSSSPRCETRGFFLSNVCYFRLTFFISLSCLAAIK
nr:MAG TPA: Herpesvirus UL49.5 envelope/tegument protein [Caudoviricetes sp.]